MTFDEADQHEAQDHADPDVNPAYTQYVNQKLQLVTTDFALTLCSMH